MERKTEFYDARVTSLLTDFNTLVQERTTVMVEQENAIRAKSYRLRALSMEMLDTEQKLLEQRAEIEANQEQIKAQQEQIARAAKDAAEVHDPETHALGMCPSCGYNLTRDQSIMSAGVVWRPDGVIMVDGVVHRITRAHHVILGTLMRANGAVITRDVLMNRIDTESETTKIVDVFVTKLRKQLREIGLPPKLIRTNWGTGYMWDESARDQPVAEAA